MDINILPLLSVDLYELCGSVAERGENAAQETWQNSIEMGREICLVKTPQEIEATKEWAKDFGAWEDEEIDGWNDEKVNAWLIQCIAGSFREMEGCESMADYEKKAEAGHICSRCWFEDIDYENGEFISGDNPVAGFYVGN